ncbi:GroES-like zinc-binding alcohol dehydrogenase family protein [Gossypium australe]|uniref:GroES-like zinc-binding alcohol dehydrogenase family protein n=1 Tax=Gossypium australe TaxID=47621 RepID=A0A5B6WIL1_9ROSI|nr:GroES-like zinc-binding alcohol dehydrogenase family protein [Gossypium australe]
MVVYINLGKPLVSKVWINGEIQRVVYEPLLTICFTCGRYGHGKELFSWTMGNQSQEEGKESTVGSRVNMADMTIALGVFGP